MISVLITIITSASLEPSHLDIIQTSNSPSSFPNTPRSKDAGHASRVVQEAKALQKNVRSRDKERAERATLVSQEKMVTMRVPRAKLSDVWARPALGGGRGRKAPGVLEVHQVTVVVLYVIFIIDMYEEV